MNTPKQRILVVDDDPMILELLSARFEKENFEVATAIDGEKAYEVMKVFQPHLILCDVLMPRVDGPTFCRRLRGENNRVPFLFLTAKGQSRDKIEMLCAGADDYVVKPFEPAELLARIHTLLRRKLAA